MIATWLSDEEKKSYSHVDDKELNELLQELRAIDGRYYVQTIQYDNRTWFDRLTGNYLKTGKVYSLMVDHGGHGFNVQCINFPPLEGTWSINTCAPKAMLMTYFFGLLTGMKLGNPLE